MEYAFEAQSLVKRYGSTTALDGVDLAVRIGEVHGFLGPNGAGKTTLIRILLGLLRADGGSVRLFGRDPWADAAELHRRLAYVPSDVNLWPTLSGGEVIDMFGRMRGGSDQRRRAELLELFELDPTKRCRAYSKGNRQKVALVAALASQTDLLILDEPTSGLDPLMEEVFQQCVIRERAAGRTVFLASHILAEAERLCDRVSIIREGRIAEHGTLAELRRLTLTRIEAELDTVPELLAGMPGVHSAEIEGTKVVCHTEPSALGEVMRYLSDRGIKSLVCQPPTLDELFLRHYRSDGARIPVPGGAS
ncbi:ABC transporter ATP-binding protein [Catenulispora rubra]|uniref:ABC transporter ATP-binding protein n=1 Tax=Catenulispora rubra TaxID=280293 RepID=UPI0018924276|nr:ABC transporter ATP-binding protein [Catenulispora rubra]